MGYRNSYEDLIRDIERAGQKWSVYDLELAKQNPDAGRGIFEQKQAWTNAKTDAERQAANRAAEWIRQQYGGYAGGMDGSGYARSVSSQAPKYVDYTSPYRGTIDSLTDQLANTAPFTYDPSADPSYQAHAERYRNAGQQAMEDTLARSAALTGGQASTYAVAAAQQAQNSYNAALSDVIPQLRDAAYEMYMDRNNALRAERQALLNMEQMDYERHLDSYDREFAKWKADYAAMMDTQTAAGGSSGKSSGGKGGSGSDGDSGEDSYLGLVERMLGLRNETAAYEYLLDQGLTVGARDQVWNLYKRNRVGVGDQEFDTMVREAANWLSASPGRTREALRQWLLNRGYTIYVTDRIVSAAAGKK